MSEENKDNQEIQENQENVETTAQPAQPAQPESWESQLQARAGEFLASRIGPLRSEIESLQATIAEMSERLTRQIETVPAEEEAGFFDHIRQWFSDSQSKAEQDFTARLETARQEWEEEGRQATEEAVQKRLESACSEAAAVARRESEAQIEDLLGQLEASRKALTLAVSSAQSASAQQTSFDNLRAGVIQIDDQRTQSDTLSALVRWAAQFAPRVVFFVVKGGDAVGWKASGFENGLNDETVRLLKVPTQAPTLLKEALNSFTIASGRSTSPGDDSAVLGHYGSPAPELAVAVPLVIRGKAAAVLYADSGTKDGDSINSAAIEVLLNVASMGIELLPARRGLEPVRPTRSLDPVRAEAAAAVQPQETSAEPEAAAAAATETTGETTGETSETEPVSTAAADTAAAAESHADEDAQVQTEAVEAAHAVDEFSGESAVDSDAEPEPMVRDRITEDLVMPEGVAEQLESAQSQEFQQADIESESEEQYYEDEFSSVPPPPPAPPFTNDRMPDTASASAPTEPIRRTLDIPDEEEQAAAPPAPDFASAQAAPRPATPIMTVPSPASETEQRAHNDARRFARLLVSEIKLYNAAKVNEGRRNFDLYDRLKDEIDRSRKVYDKRVSPAVATRFDYFYDELVQTLAEGDPAKLGPECPGPVVIAS